MERFLSMWWLRQPEYLNTGPNQDLYYHTGMVIKSQFRRNIFLPEFNAMKLYTPWRFSLGPRQISLLVMGAWILCGISSSCTWHYYPRCRRRFFLKSKVSPDMMVLGMRLSKIPPFVGKKFIIFTSLSTILVFRSFGIFWKVRLCQVALQCSLTTLILLFMTGIYSFSADRFICGPPGRDSIRIFRGPNLPSACTVVMHIPRCR